MSSPSQWQYEESKQISIQIILDDSTLRVVQVSLKEKHFLTKEFSFITIEEHHKAKNSIKLSVNPLFNSEWELLYQLRIKTGSNSNCLTIADKTVFQFTSKNNNVSFDLLDDIKCVTFELRTLNEFNLIHPSLTEGDILLRFADGSFIQTHRSLLCLASESISEMLTTYPQTDCINLQELQKDAFMELFLRLYPNRRLICHNFEKFAKVAVALRCRAFIIRLSEYLSSSAHQNLSNLDRLKIAVDLRLVPAIKDLVYKSVKSGEWAKLIEKNFNPTNLFPSEVYDIIVQPIVSEEKLPSNPTIETHFDFFSNEAASLRYNRKVLFLDTPFYINKGVLALHGIGSFRKNEQGDLVARYTKRFQRECAQAETTPGDIFLHLIMQLYPGGPEIPQYHERAAIIFCHDHGWSRMAYVLEQIHLNNPVTTKSQFIQRITFAEEFNLKNLMRSCLLYAEGSCHKYAHEFIHTIEFQKLSDLTRRQLVDRVFCGWGLDISNGIIANRLSIRYQNLNSVKRYN